MNSGIWNKVDESGYKDCLYSCTTNQASIEEGDDGKINTKKAIEVLENDGLTVTKEQAMVIIKFLKLADIAISQYLK